MAHKKKLLLDSVQSTVPTAKQKVKKEAPWRRLSRRDTDEQVKEAALRHLGDADDIDLHHKIVDGATLRDTMVEHKRLSQIAGSKKKCRFSAKYMLALREKFGVKSMLEQLVVADATEDTSKELRAAIDFATKKNLSLRTQQPLQTYFEHCTKMSQKEAVGIARHMLSYKTGGNKKTMDLVLAFMKMAVRLNIADLFKSEFQFVRAPG